MDCETFRNLLAEDPARPDPELEQHRVGCSACSAFAARLGEAERRIQQALRFDVAAMQAPPAVPRLRSGAWVGIAASVVAGFALWAVLVPPSDEQLAAEIVAHWYHEPAAWSRSDVQVSNALLDDVLAGQVAIDLAALGAVSYARSCLVGRRWIPHLVVQGQQGPVMLLLMPERSLTSPIPLELPAENLEGRLVPHGGGSIAVLGEDGEPLQKLEERVTHALSWTT